MKSYLKKNAVVDYKTILVSPHAPGVSILAPAFNEEATIIENVHSLLSLHYNKSEVIVINDGSTDKTLALLIKHYELEPVNFSLNQQLSTKLLRGVYKSKNPAYAKLLVVDKDNGGKADALNMGINISRFELILCIDADCILEQDAILKLVKPFMDSAKTVIGVGGVVHIANSCEVKNGHLVKVHLPDKLLPRFQVIEYIRAFLMGRMAWSRLNGLLIISGAMGLFDKNVVIGCGGYNTQTVGEDMELVLRMRKYMHQQKKPYRLIYIPDPLCWTECPADFKTLNRQRNRWTRGTMECLAMHKNLFFNPKYGLLGLVSYPYWLLFEWLAPLIEVLGLSIFLYMAFIGIIQWKFFGIILLMVFLYTVTLSTLTILFEEYSYRKYTSGSDLLKLLGLALVEPIVYHPVVLYCAIKGNIDFFRGKKSWGMMVRKGF
ncbi:MAG: glycosyltransferase family 2 protein [Sphingobacteriaceae bacterium]